MAKHHNAIQESLYIQILDYFSCISVEDFSDVSSSVNFYNLPNLKTNNSIVEDEVINLESMHMLPVTSDHQSIDMISSYPMISLLSPCRGTEVDNQLSIVHLLKAYGEAIEMEMGDLAEEIMMQLKEKDCLFGSTLQRLAYYLIQALDKEVNSFLKEEALMNYEVAFNVFYQIFPYGRFAHFSANSVILDAIPKDAEIVHIVDFDIGRGIQWPPIIDALGRRVVALRLTSIKRQEEDNSNCDPSIQRFEDAKMLLYEQARNFGLRLEVEEMDLECFTSDMKKRKKSGEGSEFLAFNCIVGLPHMEKRSVKSVIEFLKVAKDSILNHNGGGGTITLGDGIGWGKGLQGWHRNRTRTGYGSIFEGQLTQFKTLLESMESHFPNHLKEARIAIDVCF